jgi:hypothetical protein
MGLILRFRPHSTPLHVADNGLSAVVDVDVLDRNFLLALATMSIEGLKVSWRPSCRASGTKRDSTLKQTGALRSDADATGQNKARHGRDTALNRLAIDAYQWDA